MGFSLKKDLQGFTGEDAESRGPGRRSCPAVQSPESQRAEGARRGQGKSQGRRSKAVSSRLSLAQLEENEGLHWRFRGSGLRGGH